LTLFPHILYALATSKIFLGDNLSADIS